jgi:response regulator NasT
MNEDMSEDRDVRVLLADEDKQELAALAELVEQLGYQVVVRAVTLEEVRTTCSEETPAVAIVKVHSDDDHALRLIEELVEGGECPVLATMEVRDEQFLERAAEKGIFAYVRPLTSERIGGAIEAALWNHHSARSLAQQVSQLERALRQRAVIEQAKGIVMERHSLDEQEAFERIRAFARANNRKVVQVAASITDSRALLPSHDQPGVGVGSRQLIEPVRSPEKPC